MKLLFLILSRTVFVFVIFFIQYCALNILPFPLNSLNFVFLSLILSIVFMEESALWLVIPMALLLESFSATPFGILSVSLLISLAIVSWMFKNILTSKSAPIVFLALFIGLAVYRTIFFTLLFLDEFFLRKPLSSNLSEILVSFGVEFSVTAISTLIIYLIVSVVVRRLLPKKTLVFENSVYDKKKYF